MVGETSEGSVERFPPSQDSQRDERELLFIEDNINRTPDGGNSIVNREQARTMSCYLEKRIVQFGVTVDW